jgi:hypothetical protein
VIVADQPCLQLLGGAARSGSRGAAPSRSAFHRAPGRRGGAGC